MLRTFRLTVRAEDGSNAREHGHAKLVSNSLSIAWPRSQPLGTLFSKLAAVWRARRQGAMLSAGSRLSW